MAARRDGRGADPRATGSAGRPAGRTRWWPSPRAAPASRWGPRPAACWRRLTDLVGPARQPPPARARGGHLYHHKHFDSEQRIAAQVRARLAAASPWSDGERARRRRRRGARPRARRPREEQREAVRAALGPPAGRDQRGARHRQDHHRRDPAARAGPPRRAGRGRRLHRAHRQGRQPPGGGRRWPGSPPSRGGRPLPKIGPCWPRRPPPPPCTACWAIRLGPRLRLPRAQPAAPPGGHRRRELDGRPGAHGAAAAGAGPRGGAGAAGRRRSAPLGGGGGRVPRPGPAGHPPRPEPPAGSRRRLRPAHPRPGRRRRGRASPCRCDGARQAADLRFDGAELVAPAEREPLLERWYLERVAAFADLGAPARRRLAPRRRRIFARGRGPPRGPARPLPALPAAGRHPRRPTGAVALNAWMHRRAGGHDRPRRSRASPS